VGNRWNFWLGFTPMFAPGIGTETATNFNSQQDTIELDHFTNAQTIALRMRGMSGARCLTAGGAQICANWSAPIMIRLAKIAVTAALAAFALIVAYDNVFDYNSNYQFVRHVLSMDTIFPDSVCDHAPSRVKQCGAPPML